MESERPDPRQRLPVFLSVVLVLRNQGAMLEPMLAEAVAYVGDLATDYELVVVDNASDDDSLDVLRRLTAHGGLPNLQVFALAGASDADTAHIVGLENALGDFIAFLDPLSDDIRFLPAMLDEAFKGTDVVFANKLQRAPPGPAYRGCEWFFGAIYRACTGFAYPRGASRYRVLSRRVANFVLQHRLPGTTYRHLPATPGFTRASLSYDSKAKASDMRSLTEAIDHGVRIIVSTTPIPLRATAGVAVASALAWLAVALWNGAGLILPWMFFAITMLLAVACEYLLHLASLRSDGPAYHVAHELTSAVLTRHGKLNVEEQSVAPAGFREVGGQPRSAE